MHLTYRLEDSKSTADRPTLIGIEVTPEMLKAARAALWDGDFYVGEGAFAMSDEMLTALFRAMLKARV
jgi:hypothetical protein